MNTREAAEHIGVSSASLNRAELGARMPSPEEVSGLIVAYGVTGVAKERVLTLARVANPAGWWETSENALPKQRHSPNASIRDSKNPGGGVLRATRAGLVAFPKAR